MLLPPERQFGCVWFIRDDATHLREYVLIDAFDEDDPRRAFAYRLYEALLCLWLDDEKSGVNVAMQTEDCAYINSLLKNHMWATSDALLAQTWQVMHEQVYGQPQQLPRAFRDAWDEVPAATPVVKKRRSSSRKPAPPSTA